MALKNNTWKLNQWYDQSVAGNADYDTSSHSLWVWGFNERGQLGQSEASGVKKDSPVQVPGSWIAMSHQTYNNQFHHAINSDNELWGWGQNDKGQLGLSNKTYYSSPVQIPGTTWRSITGNVNSRLATKTDNTLWAWGYNNDGALGHNNQTNYSSPKQVPGTSWSKHIAMDNKTSFAIRTDGTLWSWGDNGDGLLGQSNPGPSHRSSPIQLPGTTWATISSVSNVAATTKTDGTVWTWGSGDSGRLGQNSTGSLASPVQLGEDTDFTNAIAIPSGGIALMKTDDTP